MERPRQPIFTARSIQPDRRLPTLAAIAVGEAKAFAEDVAIEISSEIFALIGSAATDEGLNLNRHWRNARTHTVHDANQWRYLAVGDYLLNGASVRKPLRKAAN